MKASAARLLGSLGDSSEDSIRLATALSGALPLLAHNYQVCESILLAPQALTHLPTRAR